MKRWGRLGGLWLKTMPQLPRRAPPRIDSGQYPIATAAIVSPAHLNMQLLPIASGQPKTMSQLIQAEKSLMTLPCHHSCLPVKWLADHPKLEWTSINQRVSLHYNCRIPGGVPVSDGFRAKLCGDTFHFLRSCTVVSGDLAGPSLCLIRGDGSVRNSLPITEPTASVWMETEAAPNGRGLLAKTAAERPDAVEKRSPTHESIERANRV